MGYEAYTNTRDARLRNLDGSLAALEEGRQSRIQANIGNAFASGDLAGAANAAFQGRDVQTGLVIQNADRARQAAETAREQATKDRQRGVLAAAAAGLLYVPEAQRPGLFQGTLLPRLRAEGIGDDVLQQITPETLSDASLRGFAAALGADVPDAPSGYRWGANGAQEFIPGGPADPANQRWQTTPWGFAPPPGWRPDQAPAQAGPPEYVDALPPGVRPRPNQPLSAPAVVRGERSQTPRVAFKSSGEARQAVSSLVPGVTVTNADRTTADTARIRAQGYNPSDTSFHLQGQALDLVPPRGMTMARLETKMRQAGFRVLNEGHHVHVSW